MRVLEKYVCALEVGWRVRYRRLRRSSSSSYVCMMNWLWKYYSSECRCMCSVYEGELSPLLCDVSVYVSGVFQCESEYKKELVELDAYAQLLYVLPVESWKKCGVSSILEEIRSSVSCACCDSECDSECDSRMLCNYEWAFNEYFWECVPILKNISIETLEKWDKASKIYRNAVREGKNEGR